MSEKELATEASGLTVIDPSEQETTDDTGLLSIHYRDGQPVIIVSGGAAIPETITVTDPSGTPVATYTAGPVGTARIVGGDEVEPHSHPHVISLR
ncbi:hypothetical protein [Actinokineospora sp. HUAS TT18]|uniref:hypothetical protein n=1 Tax=Actinokineospora sp. HUAS TT18 TaxID=3447451 RepID=UPI003F5242EB